MHSESIEKVHFLSMSMPPNGKKSGVELPAWLKPVFNAASRGAKLKIKDAYAEACIDWIKKEISSKPVVLAILEAMASEDEELDIQMEQAGIVFPGRKPPRKIKRA